MAGLDVIEGKIIEVNVTSPCYFIKEINSLCYVFHYFMIFLIILIKQSGTILYKNPLKDLQYFFPI